MIPSVLLPGTLCDRRVFGPIAGGLADPVHLDYRDFDDARQAAAALLPNVPAGSLGIAFSLGGWVLLEMAMMAPERFAGLVLLAVNAYPDTPANAAARLERVEQGRAKGLATLTAADWPGPVGTAFARDDRLRYLLQAMATDCGDDVHARQARLNIGRPDHRDAIERLPMPLHVVVGQQDGFCPAARYREMADAGAALHRLPGVGHFVPLEAPNEVIDVIRQNFPGAVR